MTLDMPLIIKVASIPKKGYKFILLTMMNIKKGATFADEEG
jgi:hypothetical protein